MVRDLLDLFHVFFANDKLKYYVINYTPEEAHFFRAPFFKMDTYINVCLTSLQHIPWGDENIKLLKQFNVLYITDYGDYLYAHEHPAQPSIWRVGIVSSNTRRRVATVDSRREEFTRIRTWFGCHQLPVASHAKYHHTTPIKCCSPYES